LPTGLVKNSNTAIEWPFVAIDDDYYLEVTVGTPAQKVNVSMYFFRKSYDLRIKKIVFGGSYDPIASSTYVRIGTAYDENSNPIGDMAFENFQIGNVNLTQKGFQAVTADSMFENYIGFGKPMYDSFLETVLSAEPIKGITITFDKYPNSGVVTLGDYDKKRCYKDWRVIKINLSDPSHSDSWGAQIDSITADKYSFSKPGYALFTVNDEELRWPKSVYHSILKAVGSVDDKYVPCNTTVKIVFKLEDVTIEITPDEYLDRDMESKKGVCLLAGLTVDNSSEYVLPRSLLKDYCLNINHYTKEIGLATRKDEKDMV